MYSACLIFFEDCSHNFGGKNCDPLGVITVIDLSARGIGLSCSLTSGLDARPEIQTLNASY